MFKNRYALFVGGRDDDLKTKLLVEAHHLALILAVHFGESLVKNSQGHTGRTAGGGIGASVDRR